MLSSKCGRFHVIGTVDGECACLDCGLPFDFGGEGQAFGIVEVVPVDD